MSSDKKDIGQFFTHPKVASFMAKLLNPQENQHIIDPACGDAEFLFHLHNIESHLNLYGCEIDNIARESALKRLPNANIFLHNGLYSNALFEGEENIEDFIKDNFFDALIANPPFNGLTNKVVTKEILEKFDLAYKDNKLRKAQSIEILFVERFVQLLKPQGKFCIIVPEGILSDERLTYLRNWIYERCSIEVVISLPKRGVFENANVNAVIICGRKKPCATKNVFYAREITLEDLDIIYDYMKRSNIFA